MTRVAPKKPNKVRTDRCCVRYAELLLSNQQSSPEIVPTHRKTMAPGAIEEKIEERFEQPQAKLPPGVVLGPDGKPYVLWRTLPGGA
jgi:hypothetical protein